MATRRDQLHSYQFLLQRVISALVYRKTDPAQSPFRRAGVAVFAGVMLTVLALAITAVIGLFISGFGQQDDWRDGGTVIMEKETGATYVILPPSDENGKAPGSQKLYPTLNFASAALLAGTTTVTEVSQASLEEDTVDGDQVIPRAHPVGIMGAPNSVPTPSAIKDSNWLLCSVPPSGDDSGSQPRSKLFIGSMKSEGGKALNKGEALLVRDQDATYMVTDGYAHEITDAETVVNDMEWKDQSVMSVDSGYIAGLPQGDPIAVPEVDKLGEASGAVDNATNGEVYKTSSSGQVTFYAVLDDGIAEISQFQAELLMAATGKKTPGNGSELSGADESTTSLLPDGETAPPQQTPSNVEEPDAENPKPQCAGYSDGKATPQVSFDVKLEKAMAGTSTSEVNGNGKEFADTIAVTPGTGALVSTGASAIALVTDTGFIYGLEQGDPQKKKGGDGLTPTATARTALGYGPDAEEKAAVVKMPPQLVSLIPGGPTLSSTDAMKTVNGNSEQ